MKSRPILPGNTGPDIVSNYFKRGRYYSNWRPKGSGDYLLIYTHSGAGTFVTPSGTFHSRMGDAVLYGPRDMQDYSTSRTVGKWNLLWSHFTPKPHWQVWLNWPANPQNLRLIHFENPLRGLFRAALKETIRLSRLQIPEAADLAANALEKALLWAHAADSDKKWLALDSRVRRAIDYLVLHFRQPYQMEALAAHCHVSPSRLAHLFKDATQTSPQQFLEKHRIQQACNLLRITQVSIAEIATEVGYADPFYFTNRFRRHTGKSPTQFRRNADSYRKARAGKKR